MLKKILFLPIVSISLYAGTTGCKYQSDLKKINTVGNKVKFMMDNHCVNLYNPASWKRIKTDGVYTLVQSPHDGEENYKYWVKTKELPKKTIKKETEKKTPKKKDFKTTMNYGDLMWQDSLINETKMMSFNKANSYCKKLNYKGSKNWRLPTVAEMNNIRPASWQSSYQPYKDFKHIQLKEYYWSSDRNTQFVFSSGATNAAHNYPALVRCVTPRR